MKKILLTAKIVRETDTSLLIVFPGSPAWIWVSRAAVSKQSKTMRMPPESKMQRGLRGNSR